MKIFYNPFAVTNASDHLVEERNKRHKHIYETIWISLAMLVFGLAITPYIAFVLKHQAAFNRQTFADFLSYMRVLLSNNAPSLHLAMINDPRSLAGRIELLPGHDDHHMKVLLIYTSVGLTFGILGALRQLFNPYRKLVMKADAEWCTARDLKMMEANRQVGIKGGQLAALGRWPYGLRKGQMIKLIETLSVLCMAPPGTGKTAGFVVPTLVTCDNTSVIVNDVKPELFDLTGGHREKCSYVFMLNWTLVDCPEKNIFYPRFNFLSPKLVPPPGPYRDTYIDTVAKTLIPDKNGGETYFVDKGRSALTGFIHYLIARVGDAKDDRGLPAQWKGCEPSIPMLTDWMAVSLQRAANASNNGDMPPEEMQQEQDPMGKWISELVTHIDPSKYGVGRSQRAFNELTPLIMMADKERSGVLGTMDQALLPFKNESVKQRTSASDFTPDDMRGILDPKITERTELPKDDPRYLDPKGEAYKKLADDDANWKPISLYICINQADAPAFASITALLYEVLSNTLLAYGKREYNVKTQRHLGPFPVCFVLDEFAKLPKVQAVIDGPDLGRSKGVSYLLVAQSIAQIEKIYGKEQRSIIESSTAVKLAFNQNDKETIQSFISLVGKTTIRRHGVSRTVGFGAKHIWNDNMSEVIEETDFLRNTDVSAMRAGWHMLIIQAFLSRPMRVKTPLWFKDPDLVTKVCNPRIKDKSKAGPQATIMLPIHILAQRSSDHNKSGGKKKLQQHLTLDEIDYIADRDYDEIDALELSPELEYDQVA